MMESSFAFGFWIRTHTCAVICQKKPVQRQYHPFKCNFCWVHDHVFKSNHLFFFLFSNYIQFYTLANLYCNYYYSFHEIFRSFCVFWKWIILFFVCIFCSLIIVASNWILPRKVVISILILYIMSSIWLYNLMWRGKDATYTIKTCMNFSTVWIRKKKFNLNKNAHAWHLKIKIFFLQSIKFR